MKHITKMAPTLIVLLAFIAIADLAAAQRRRGRQPDVFKFLAQKYDANNDGELTKEEYDRSEENFSRFDTNKDGVLTAADWSAHSGRQRRGGRRNHAGGSAPKVGDDAPDFTLTHIEDEEKQVQLSSFAGKKPVALIFGSCT